jgi:hypothetical protein
MAADRSPAASDTDSGVASAFLRGPRGLPASLRFLRPCRCLHAEHLADTDLDLGPGQPSTAGLRASRSAARSAARALASLRSAGATSRRSADGEDRSCTGTESDVQVALAAGVPPQDQAVT